MNDATRAKVDRFEAMQLTDDSKKNLPGDGRCLPHSGEGQHPKLEEKSFLVTIKSQSGVRWLVEYERVRKTILGQTEQFAAMVTDGLLPIVEVQALPERRVADTLPRWFCPKCQRVWLVCGKHADCDGAPHDMVTCLVTPEAQTIETFEGGAS